MAHREKVRELVGSAIAAQRCFHETIIKIPKQMNVKCLETATSERSKENE